MAATATQDRTDAKGGGKKKAAKAEKEKDKAAKAKAKEEKAVKAKEKAAKAKTKDKAAKAKEKDKAAKAKAKEEKAAKAKEKAAQAKTKSAKADRRPAEPTVRDEAAGDAASAQPVEEVAAPERGESVQVPAQTRSASVASSDAPDTPPDSLPDIDKTVRPTGWVAEVLGKQDAVSRSTKRATIAASYTTRDHDVVRRWAESRGGRPADVAGTGDRGAGVLRIEFPDGPGDDSRLEDVDWSAFFATFDDSNVDFLYQERVRAGGISRFHKFVRADS